MSLNSAALAISLSTRLKDNFTRSGAESWSADRAADELAKAIADTVEVYVTAGRVKGVASEVRNLANAVIGTAQQSNAVALS